jgi:shikimate dehydrogenase
MNLYGLIGYPLGHSFSKKYFTDKFEKDGLGDCFFELFPIKNINEFPLLLKKHKDLKGIAVTIPYKQSVMAYLDSINAGASEVGAVNCIKINAEKMIGYNTDIIGFENSFKPHLKFYHKKALVLGTGGASKAVQFVLKKLQIPFLLVSRLPNSANTISYDDVNENVLADYNIIINCSPVGMSPNENEMPELPYQFITAQHYLYDLVYKPEETKFLQQGKLASATIKNGYEMLVLQANENWRIWSV